MTTIKPYYPGSGFASTLYHWLRSLKKRNFYLLAAVYLILVRIQGLDFNDEGFHLAFYQQIFSDPGSVEYGFWMWLTGIIAGGFMKLFPWSGMMGIRLLGAGCTLATMILAYEMLRHYVQEGRLRLSMLLLLLFINEDAKNLYYNNLSAFFYCCAAFALFKGLTRNKPVLILLAGAIAGINVFSRIPNILGAGLGIVIIGWALLEKKNARTTILALLQFAAGFVLGIGAMLLLMLALGHWEHFTHSVQMVFAASKDAGKQDGTGGAYGIVRMFTRNTTDYLNAARALIQVLFVLVLTGLGISWFSKQHRWATWTKWVLPALLALTGIYLILAGQGTAYRLLMLFTGLGLISFMQILQNDNSTEKKLLVLTGLLIMLIHPFGSSEGISTVVVYSLWLAVPLGWDWLFQLETPFGKQHAPRPLLQSLTRFWHPGANRPLLITFRILLFVACLYNVVRFPYLCDRHSRLEMTRSISHPRAWGILTSPARAKAINELLEASARYAPPGTVVLGYDCMPLYHYLSETRSYVRNPCIWFYSNTLFREELSRARSTQSTLPVIVRQLIHTTGEGSSWPDVKPELPYAMLERNKEKNALLQEFILQNQYTEVWNNGSFAILTPGNFQAAVHLKTDK